MIGLGMTEDRRVGGVRRRLWGCTREFHLGIFSLVRELAESLKKNYSS